MQKTYIYGLGERIWHWVQALGIVVLLYTGFKIHFMNPAGNGFLDLYRWHYVFGFILIFNTFVGNIYFLSNHTVSQFIPIMNSQFLDGFFEQAKYYLMGRFKGESHPFHKTRKEKLNPLQKTVYFGMLFITLPIQFVTGLMLLYAKGWLSFLVGWVGGFAVVSIVHVISAFLFMAFLVVHIYLTFLTKPFYKNYYGMITGYEPIETTEGGAK